MSIYPLASQFLYSRCRLIVDESIPKGVYQHYKGNMYEVLGTARHSETDEIFVIYKTLYGDHSSWVRPLENFTEELKIEGVVTPRFRRISSQNLDEQ